MPFPSHSPSLSTQLLASSIPITDDEIHYMVYEGDYSAVWDFRRRFVEEEQDIGLINSISKSKLWTVQVISQSIHRFWLFQTGRKPFSIVHAPATLIKVAESTITPRHLYPCSEECSHSTMPCSNCSPTPHPNLNSNSPTTAAEYLPRRPWRRAWNAFIDAVKARVIRAVNRGSRSTNRTAIALKSGFILHPNTDPHTNSEEWVTSGWEHVLVRPLLYVHIQIRPVLDSDSDSDSQLRLVVHPTITQTPYYGFRLPGLLASPHAAHVVPGTALTLLPFGTPAYFVAPYSGPTSALAAQFRDVLGGLGVDGWDSKVLGRPSRKDGKPTSYAIVYIPVHMAGVEGQNSQRSNNKGRGVTIIYPSRLVLTLPASIRRPLNPALLPPLPAPLMPSPMVAFAVAAGVGVQPGLGPSLTTGNGSINSPIAGSGYRINSPIVGHGLRQFQFPPNVTAATPVSSSSGAGNPNVFPTLNSPLGVNFGFNQAHGHTHLQLQQQQQHHHLAPSPSTSDFVPSSLPAITSINSSSGFRTSTLLRAHRAVSTASRLRNDTDIGGTTTSQGSGEFHPGAPTPGTTVGAPTPSAPTPGTVGAATPGAPTPGAGTGSVSAPTPGATVGTPGGPMSGTGFRLIPSSTTSLSSLSLTAAEVSSYVDHVAREREKERERLREAQQRERLGLGNARNASYITNISSGASGSGTSTGTRSVQVPPLFIPPNSNTHPALIPPPPATTANTDAQMFYPSPPTNPPSVSASGAMSPVIGAIHGPVTLPPPQLPQGLPSMHDVQSSKAKLVPPPSPHGETDHVAEAATQPDNSIVKTPVVEEALTETTSNIIPEPQSTPAAAPTTSAHDSTSTWNNYGYFGSEGMDLTGMGMDMGMGSDDMMNMNMTGMGMNMNISGLGDNTEMNMDMNMNMALFGVDSGTFDLSNFGGGDWNMDSTFGFGSSSKSGAPAAAGPISGNGGAPANSSFPSFNGFSQPVPPSMNRAVTAPSHVQIQAQTQTQTQRPTQRSTTEWEEAFTDDDFSFFDHKSSASSSTMITGASSMIPPSPASAPPTINHNPNALLSPDPLAFLVNSDDSSSFFSSLGLGIPNMNPIISASVTTPGSSYYSVPNPNTPGGLGLGAGFTPSPLTVNIEVEMDPGLPSPPDEADSASAYQVELERSRGNIPSPLSSPFRPSPRAHSQFSGTVPLSPSRDKDKKFAPIPFAKSHSLADGKYQVAGGKFALLRSSSGWFHKRPRLRPPYLASTGQDGKRLSWTAGAGTDSWRKHMLTGTEDHSKQDREDDGKSEVERGKWTLPSPPVDSDDTDSSEDEDLALKFSPPMSSSNAPSPPIRLTITPPASNALRPGWRPRYDRATDPRIGVVRKLTGHRSKKQQGSGSNPLKRKRPRWMRNWEEETGRHETGHVQSGDDSEMDDDDDDDDDGTVDGNEDGVKEEEEGMDGIVEGSSSKKLRKSGHRERSRPPTPLPAYLPPGPSLVATCFHWVHLVNMVGVESTISTAEGMISEPYQTQLPPFQGIHGVPTPVSPATFTGGMSTAASPAFAPTPGPTSQALTPSADADPDEKIRTFEAIACAIARESVENYIWMDSWDTMEGLVGDSQSGADLSSNAKWNADGSIGCVWPLEVRAVKQLLGGSEVFGSEALEIGDIFDAWSPIVSPAPSSRTAPSSSSSLIPLPLPLLSVAKSEAIIHVMPTALRFWDKLGLGPKSGEKNVTAFVINGGELGDDSDENGFEKATKWRDEQTERWLRNTSELYKARQLGEMVLGKSSFCQKDGVVSLQFDSSFKKTLGSFVRSLPIYRDSFIFFILTPLSSMTLTSDTLRHLLSAVQNVTANHPQAHMLFQLVPEPQILNTAVHPSSPQDFCSWSFVASLYDRILMPVDRAMSREFFTHGKRVKKYFQAPMFSLARPLTENKVSYSGATDPSLDVLDRHTFFHVGYQLSSCGRWILAACTDQRGEAHDIGVWSTQPGLQGNKKEDDESCTDVSVVTDEMYVVGKVWEFAMQFAEKANVEWRIVFAKLGAMGAVELDAWMTHLYTALHSISKNAQAPVHVSVLGVEPSAPWIGPPKPSQSASPIPPQPHLSVAKGSSSLSRAVSGSLKTSSKSQVFVDTSTVAYAVFQKDSISIPIGVPPTLNDFSLASDVLMNTNTTMLVHPENLNDDDLLVDLDNIPLLPLSSSALVRVPTSSTDSLALSQMVHVHLLYAAKSEGSAYPTVVSNATDGYQSLLQDITNSFYSLSVLSSARGLYMASNSNSLLPLHLVAVATMRNALSTRADSFYHYS